MNTLNALQSKRSFYKELRAFLGLKSNVSFTLKEVRPKDCPELWACFVSFNIFEAVYELGQSEIEWTAKKSARDERAKIQYGFKAVFPAMFKDE